MELIWTPLGLPKIVSIVVIKLYFLDPIPVEYIPFWSCESNNIAQTTHIRTILLSLFFPKIGKFWNSFHKKVRKLNLKTWIFPIFGNSEEFERNFDKKKFAHHFIHGHCRRCITDCRYILYAHNHNPLLNINYTSEKTSLKTKKWSSKNDYRL